MQFSLGLTVFIFLGVSVTALLEFRATSDVFWGANGVGCINDLEDGDCPEGLSLAPNILFNGRCPGCVKYIDIGNICDPKATLTEPRCRPGLMCVRNTTDGEVYVCKENSTSCFSQGGAFWKPDCYPDGTFQPVQCKGDLEPGRCFCYSANGKRIFGLEWRKKSENMTCSCSRKVSDLQTHGQDATYHCNSIGNFESLQCDSGMCWCAEEKTGRPITTVVPEILMQLLPCYTEATHGNQYFRFCDSVQNAQRLLTKTLKEHGTSGSTAVFTNCELDGSYGAVQPDGERAYCAWKDKLAIGSWAAPIDQRLGMDCYCARDSKYYFPAVNAKPLECTGSGNYKSLQINGDQQFCVDRDGWAIAGPFGLTQLIDCKDYQ